MADHSEYRNYMDDDTVELGCHYCKWQEDGIEDDNAATTLGQPTPILFYDFNMPPRERDGLYLCKMARGATHFTGQSVIFGCQIDEVMARGIIEELDGDFLRVRLVEWLPCERLAHDDDA